jgi:hypothetical protein
MSKGLQIKFKHEFGEGFIQLVDDCLKKEYEHDDDKLIMAALAEIRHRIYIRIEKPQKKYTMTLTPVQALGVRLFYTDFINEPTTYMGGKLHMIALDVKRKFNL